MLFESMHPTWQAALESQRSNLESIEAALSIRGEQILPAATDILRAFSTPIDDVRVLIVGQDPYPTPGDAIGLAFAVNLSNQPARALPRSLKNLMAELASDLGDQATQGGDIARWQSQGVMLLNRTLTVAAGKPGSHADLGWSKFTDAAVAALDSTSSGKLVAVLWGKHAQQVEPLLRSARVISGVHPSPLSAHRGFFGSRPFSQVNSQLNELGIEPIDWSC